MAIERWDPFRDVVSLRDAVNSLLAESFVRPGQAVPAGPAILAVDVSETENEYVVKASMPGIKPDDVQITVHGDTVTIRGESKVEEERSGETYHVRELRTGSFQRSFSFPSPVDPDKAVAQFENGVLALTLPKAESAKPKQIRIGKG
jgi:HSP20 family protein